MRIHRLALTACVALAAIGVLSGNASTQDYPSKPLRLIVPFPPGGGTPEKFGVFIKSEIAKYAKVVKAAGIRAE